MSNEPASPSDPTLEADPRRAALASLRERMSKADLDGAAQCALRLHDVLPTQDDLRENVVLVAYGGGKDSSYMLAFVRLMQLLIDQIYGVTFSMRVATNRHAGMPRAVMENMDRAYRALGLFDDPDCKMLLIDGAVIKPFYADLPPDAAVVARNREDILMTGHRTAADARPTFCNACNLSMVNAFGLAAGHDGGVDLIITGDSLQEQRDYYLWVTRLARKLGVPPSTAESGGFRGFLEALNGISHTYFADIHGVDATERIAGHAITTDVRPGLRFFSIYNDTDYASGQHWELLTEFMKFEFDDIAFSFTESDCGNPSLMAHLRALKSERRYGRSYDEGLAEYVEFATGLMVQKEFPDFLIESMKARYSGPGAASRMRASMDAYAQDAYAFTEGHLVAMVYAPFAEHGTNLSAYLAAEQPDLVAEEGRIRGLLAGSVPPGAPLTDRDREVVERLEALSGLRWEQLRVLYAGSLRLPSTTPVEGEIIDQILAGDPHKQVVMTRQEADGDLVPELLSGR